MSGGNAVENIQKELEALETQLEILQSLKTPEEGASEFVDFVMKTNEPFSPNPLESDRENPWRETAGTGGCCTIS